MLDTYSLKARIFPIVILLTPLLIVGVMCSVESNSSINLLYSLGSTTAFSYFLSQLGRDAGKRKEKKLWNSWGGPPSTQALRYSNNIFDMHTKKRYHAKLNALCPLDQIPTVQTEHENLSVADSVYEAWVRYLIANTRDSKKFNLLLKENTSYGFRRNLWGMKPLGIFISLFSLASAYLFFYWQTQQFSPILYPIEYWSITVILLLFFLIWIFKVKSSWVKIPAEGYATRLCEAVDQL